MDSYSFSSRFVLNKTNPRVELVRDGLSKEDALRLESLLIEQAPCCNKILSRTDGKVDQYHRDKITRPHKHEVRLKKFAAYRQKNHSVINAKLSRKIACEHGCGSIFQYRNKGQHRKSCKVLNNKQ